MQASVRVAFHGEDAHVLPLLFYSDGAELREAGQRFHPLLLYIGSLKMEGIRHRDGCCRIAMLPVLDAKEVGLQPGSN